MNTIKNKNENILGKEPVFEYKTLLTEEEYDKIIKANKDVTGDVQTNYYFDTKRFTLKATDAVLRVKRTDKKLVIIFERKKGYNLIRIENAISEDDIKVMVNEGIITDEEVKSEVNDIIKDQKIQNFMNLSTYRVYIPYKNSRFALDKCDYCNTTDYEIEFQTKNREGGKLTFVQLIKDYNINYKKSQVKLKRAFDAYRKIF